jgi:hypothetical protein
MENLNFYISIALYLIIPLSLFIILVLIIYRRIKGKKWFGSGTSFIAEHLYTQWESKEGKAAVEEIQYQRDHERDDAESGDPPEPGERSSE